MVVEFKKYADDIVVKHKTIPRKHMNLGRMEYDEQMFPAVTFKKI